MTLTPVPEDLSSVHPYPNPVRVRDGTETIRFPDPNGDIRVRIYTMAGRHVITLENQGSFEVVWDLRNAKGGSVGGGIYIWIATNSKGDRRLGRLAIIK